MAKAPKSAKEPGRKRGPAPSRLKFDGPWEDRMAELSKAKPGPRPTQKKK